jgi:hypothetical protein
VYNKALGISTFQVLLLGPDSSKQIDVFLSFESLFARTHPAEPAPMII